ncbi:MAG: tetratricopeptide repeat protein, partial [Azonexus sp.]|nr:tetratricopeptide repeat protein [Azonexus sp.]
NTARWPNDEVSANGLADVLKARGELEAAETQYRQNTARWPNDEVSANGLADVLKARGELEAAETQYRQNTARWPNDRIAVNGLANVLRKQKRHVEALELLSDRSGSLVTPQDTYDLHLRAMILLDLGRLGDARVALELGLKAVLAPRDPAAFRSGLALVALREREFEAARTILSALPANVIPLDLIRLHVEAAQNRGDQAGNLARVLGGRQSQMKFGEVRVFELVRNGFGISSAGVGRQPANDELDEIFDAEIELLLAA